MIKLIRDKVPQTKKCNYAVIQNDEFYAGMLKEKLVEEVNEFLLAPELISVEGLIDIELIIKSLVANKMKPAEFEELYNKKIDEKGGFDKKYIVFLDDAPLPTQPQEGKINEQK